MAKITLNGNNYWTPEGEQIQPYLVNPQAEAFSTDGSSRRLDNTKLRRFVLGWEDGLGYHRKKREQGRGVNGLRDADAETRWDVVSLPLQSITNTHSTDGRDHLKAYAHHKGDLWGLFEEDYNSGAVQGLWAAKYTNTTSPASWTGGGQITDASGNAAFGIRAFDWASHKGELIAVGTYESGTPKEGAYAIFASADGASWNEETATGWPKTTEYVSTDSGDGITRNNNKFDDDMARVVSFGNTLLVAIYEDPGSEDGSISQIRVLYTTNSGANFTAGAVISSGSGPKAFVLWNDPFTAGHPIVPILVTQENIYKVAHAGTTFEALLPSGVLSGTSNNGRRAAVGAGTGYLYVGTEDGDVLEIGIVSVNNIFVQNVGPATQSKREPGDGLLSARQGHVNFILGTNPRWLFVAYGGHESNKYASVLAMDYKTGAWHSVFLDGTANRDIISMTLSSEDDQVTKLHISIEGAAASVLIDLDEVLTPPTAGAAQRSYATSGYIEFAEDDHGDPHVPSALIEARIDANDLSADDGGEYVEHHFGTDGGAWTATDLGNYFSGDKDLAFGSGVGVSAKTARHRIVLNRDAGTTTDTPKINELEVVVRTRLATLKGFRIPIDLGLTAQLSEIPVETVITNLISAVDSVTLIALDPDPDRGLVSAINVEVTNYSARLDQDVEAVSIGTEQRSGIWVLDVEEVL
jgi:hypothetical protein